MAHSVAVHFADGKIFYLCSGRPITAECDPFANGIHFPLGCLGKVFVEMPR